MVGALLPEIPFFERFLPSSLTGGNWSRPGLHNPNLEPAPQPAPRAFISFDNSLNISLYIYYHEF